MEVSERLSGAPILGHTDSLDFIAERALWCSGSVLAVFASPGVDGKLRCGVSVGEQSLPAVQDLSASALAVAVMETGDAATALDRRRVFGPDAAANGIPGSGPARPDGGLRPGWHGSRVRRRRTGSDHGGDHHVRTDTIYTLKLRRRGIDQDRHPGTELLRSLNVGAIMDTGLQPLPSDTAVTEGARRLFPGGHLALPVTDRQGRLTGVVTVHSLSEVLGNDDDKDQMLLSGIAEMPATVLPGASLEFVFDTLLDSCCAADDRVSRDVPARGLGVH